MKKRLIIGFVLLLISFIQFLFVGISVPPWFILIFIYLFMIGGIAIFDAITLKFYNRSLTHILTKNKKNLLKFFLVSIIGTLLIEVIAHWFGKLWIYPSWNYLIYFVFAFTGFVLYWLFIVGSYLSTKAVIDYFRKGKKYVTKSFRWESKFFKVLGIVGIILLIISSFLVYFYYTNQSMPFVQLGDLFQKTSSYVLPYSVILLFVLSLWFILEYLQYKFKKTSLIKDIIHGHFTPFLSIIIGSFLFAIIVEIQNFVYYVWLYINWPLEEIIFLSLPMTMFLAWPLHYIIFLSLWRAFTDEQSEEVWKGDLIK